jgi:hypothetical protein
MGDLVMAGVAVAFIGVFVAGLVADSYLLKRLRRSRAARWLATLVACRSRRLLHYRLVPRRPPGE